MKKIYFIGNAEAEFAKKDFNGRSDKGKKRDINKKYKDKFSSDEFKNTLKRNYAIAGVLGTAAGLGIAGYALYKNKRLPQGNIEMPKISKNPLSHLNPKKSVEGALKKYEEEFDVAAQIHRNVKERTKDSGFKNTGGWLLRPAKQNLKVKSNRRSLNLDNSTLTPNIKNVNSVEEVQKFRDRYEKGFKERKPVITIGKKSGKKPKRFKITGV